MKESKIEAFLKREVEKRGGRADKWTSPNLPGVPDRIVLLPGGRVIFVELKTEIGKLSGLQKWYHRQLQDLGMDIRTLYSIEQVQAFVKEVMPL